MAGLRRRGLPVWHRGCVPAASHARDTFDAVDHADGSVLGSFPVAREDDVRAALDAARDVVPRWAGARVAERARLLRGWRGELWRTSSQLAGVLHRESGVPFDEAMVELLQVVEHLRWVEQNAGRVLDPRHAPRGRFTPELDVTTASVPEGVVGVVASGRPSLYALTSAVACALVAGNPVVVVPQRRLAATAVAVADAFATAHPDAPPGLLQVLTGDDETALALAGAPLDRLAFLGTPVAAVRVATVAARALVPLDRGPGRRAGHPRRTRRRPRRGGLRRRGRRACG